MQWNTIYQAQQTSLFIRWLYLIIVSSATDWGYIMYCTNIIFVLWPFCGTTEGFCHYIYHYVFVNAYYEAMSCIVALLYKMHRPTLLLCPTATTTTCFLQNVILTFHHAPYHLLLVFKKNFWIWKGVEINHCYKT